MLPRNRISRPVLLLAAILVLAATIVFAFFRNVPFQRNETTVGKQAEARPAKRPADGHALSLSQGAARSQTALYSQDANDTVGSKASLKTSNESVPRAPKNQSSQVERAVAEFHQSRQCHVAWNEIKGLQIQIAECEPFASATDNICRHNIKQARAQIQIEIARLAGCNTVPAVLEKAYFDSVARAAELGDNDAQVCYIQGDFFNEMGRQLMEQYKHNARNYIQLGLERGDWRVVSLLATHSVDYSGRLGELALENPYDILRMNRLLRHGATGDYAQLLDSMAQDSAVSLSKAQLDSAFAWSRQEYEKYFINSPKLTARLEPCAVVQTDSLSENN